RPPIATLFPYTTLFRSKREVLAAIDLDKIQFVGYAFQIEMKFKSYIKNFKITEVPVIFTDRTKGTSKMSSGIISEAVFGVINMRSEEHTSELQSRENLV